MFTITGKPVPRKKRKRTIDDNGDTGAKQSSTATAIYNAEGIARLEADISKSQKNLNSVATLLRIAEDEEQPEQEASKLSLCRVFCRLLAEDKLTKSKNATENELVIVTWLKERYQEYKRIILQDLDVPDKNKQLSALKCTMLLVAQEARDEKRPAESVWKSGIFSDALLVMLQSKGASEICQTFATDYVQKYPDVRYFTFHGITEALSEEQTASGEGNLQPNCLNIMINVAFAELNASEEPLLGRSNDKAVKRLQQTLQQKKAAQSAWLAVMHSGLTKSQRKQVLNIMTYTIVPWFQQVERLMDFLTDSFDQGGATSLLALSGLFHLIQEKNLDYPAFYLRLYSLLDHDLLHSKHRSRFFRLLSVFMASTHLPAALVASFIKKLARLALDAPPAGIVAVIPWVYNMLRAHPACTFMLHRETRTFAERQALENNGMDDPFNDTELDPMLTNALESSLWELETLQFHYHPNVASLARIISEQFTKANYNLEDFLDLSYANLIEAELGKELKKTPVSEFQIPKTIFVEPGLESGPLKDLMTQILAA